MVSKTLLPLLAGTASALDVVIYGGGASSGTLLNGLKQFDHIDVHYYDPNPDLTPTSFRLLGFAPQVHTALKLMSPELDGAIERSSWYPEEPSIIVMGQGPHAGEVVLDYSKLPNTTHHPQVTVVDPKPYLTEMLNGTAKSHLHPNMTLTNINDPKDGPLELTFNDGSKVTADVLIGDDNMAGFMRSYVLGPDNVATYPVFMNFLSAIAHVPPKDAHKLLGSPYGDIESGYRYERVGNGSWFLNAYLEGFFTCLGSFYTEEKYDLSKFIRPTSVEELEHYFGGFKDGDNLVEILAQFSGLRLIPEVEHLPAPTYVKGRVAMSGNAAHTMSNFQQLGQGALIEDAMILQALLGASHTRSGLEAALQVYSDVRRPRNHMIAEHAKGLGKLWTGVVDGVGIDPKKLRAAFLKLKEDEEAFDLVAHREGALVALAAKLQENKVNGGETKAAAQKAREVVDGYFGWASQLAQARLRSVW